VPFQTPIAIAKVLERIHSHEYVLPAIQREFVWRAAQVCTLFDSLMRGYPIGSFLFWQVQGRHSGRYVFYDFIRDYHELKSPHCARLAILPGQAVTAILDGQQRLTALNIGLRDSHAEKLPRKWASSVDAYPRKELYLDLRHRGTDDELGLEYQFRFLSEMEAAPDPDNPGGPHWFRVRRILDMKPGPEMFAYVRKAGLTDDDTAFELLDRLHQAICRDLNIQYYEEEAQDLDKVLNIFIRVNSGGTVLSYSDLLLSVATAQWEDRDARQEIHDLVDTLNETGQGFAFSKDIVLKAGLVLMDKPDIRFKVTNFDRATMQKMEGAWDEIAEALRLGARLLADFGFSARTLTADSVLIPLAYYVHQRGLDGNYLSRSADSDDRRAMRAWVTRSLLKGGVWGSGLDTLITGLRRVLQGQDAGRGFPVAGLEEEMARQGKSLRFEATEIEDLLNAKYGSRGLFALLALLYPGIDVRRQFHEDHVFPRSRFTRKRLLDGAVPETAVEKCLDVVDRLPNLQLLEGPENFDKRAKLPAEWVRTQYPDPTARAGWLAANDLQDLPEKIADFLAFYEARQVRMKDRLTTMLGAFSQ
jgi:hypothetical protein